MPRSCTLFDPNDMKCPGTAKFVEPFSFSDQPEQAMARLKAALLSDQRVTITNEQPTYLSAEVHSQLFGFVDDMKFVFMPEQGAIQVRSSARTGYSDMGVNRRRIERICTAFNASDQGQGTDVAPQRIATSQFDSQLQVLVDLRV